MNNELQNKTSFELNVLVAMLEHPYLADFKDDEISEGHNGSAWFERHTVTNSGTSFEGTSSYQSAKNYTNSWQNMGPIIEREMLSIESHGHGSRVRIYGYSVKGLHEVIISSNSILKGFAICYLMMKGAE